MLLCIPCTVYIILYILFNLWFIGFIAKLIICMCAACRKLQLNFTVQWFKMNLEP